MAMKTDGEASLALGSASNLALSGAGAMPGVYSATYTSPHACIAHLPPPPTTSAALRALELVQLVNAAIAKGTVKAVSAADFGVLEKAAFS